MVLEDLRAFVPQNLSDIGWAFVKAEVAQPIHFDKEAYEVIEHRDLRSFAPQNIPNYIGTNIRSLHV